MPSVRDNSAMPLVALEIDKTGRLSRKLMGLDRQATLENTLLQSLFPGIRVAMVDLPQEPLGSFEQALIEQALVRIEFDGAGVRYSLVGATGSAKNGKFYAVDAAYEKKVAERFRCSPQAAITYFGILVSSCKVRIEEPDCRVLVVEDHEFGTKRLPRVDFPISFPEAQSTCASFLPVPFGLRQNPGQGIVQGHGR